MSGRERKRLGGFKVDSDVVVEDAIVEEPPESPVEEISDSRTFHVNSHLTHAGQEFETGDPITLDNPTTVRKLKERGVIS